MSSQAPHILRLSQFAEVDATAFRVELTLDGGIPFRTPVFPFKLSPQDRESLRWYLEDYPVYPTDPQPKIAQTVEQRITEIGNDLFRAVFQSSDDARDLWAKFRESLDDARIEIVTSVREAASIPWELIRDPKTDMPLALRARAFVRAHANPVQSPQFDTTQSTPIRILLVICRPGGEDDVPFRSVASFIVKGLGEKERTKIQLDVLRPPTFARLGQVLRAAKQAGMAYHAVHFDGHGIYAEVAKKNELGELRKRISAIVFSGLREGSHGYLEFENSAIKENIELVDGAALGKLLVETDVNVLVLNACRSAFAETLTEPVASNEDDTHAQTRAFGTLAQEVMEQGVPGVVAMRYNLFVVTAAEFVVNLYAALAQGQSLGEAVTFGRKQLAINPQREIAYKPIALQDWSVPIVYEASAIELFPRRVETLHATSLRITIDKEMTQRGTEIGLPPRPDIGFFGRDETLLALDRAFDSQQIVLLHAFAGSGKTTTAAEFARWYALTGGITLSGAKGGVEGTIFFSSFEHRKTLTEALNETIGRAFNDALEASGVHWLTLTDEQRRAVALQVMRQVPMLWIWDNIEPVNGFPAGTKSAWSEAEQSELKKFLADARETQAKFLLTSRRDEQKWLGDLPRRILIPPMPMQERVQLARALAEKVGRRITEVDDWTPLLRFTQGNPLTITVVVGEALRKGLKTKADIGDFVTRLRAGETAFADEVSEGRSKSLGASLSYGFENAFSETERKQLALLHFFQGFVDRGVLRMMGGPEFDWCLPEVRGLTIEDATRLLDRAAEIGLLTARGMGYYTIHPALPWYFKSLFDQYYPSETNRPFDVSTRLSAAEAFVAAVGQFSNMYRVEYQRGIRSAIGLLSTEETNLLYARRLACMNGWWNKAIDTMLGLQILYEHTGRNADWECQVNEILPNITDSKTNGPLAGCEEQWSICVEYRVHLLRRMRHFADAERLQHLCIKLDRERAAPALAALPSVLNSNQQNAIRTLAVSLHDLGQILREQSKPECVQSYEESANLAHRIGDKDGEKVAAFNLSCAYMEVPALHNLALAEHWLGRSMELHNERDKLGRGRCLGQKGHITYTRFQEGRRAKKSERELLRLLNEAARSYRQSLEMFPNNAVPDLLVVHSQLGRIFGEVGDIDSAIPHYLEAIRYAELAGNLFKAGQYRSWLAVDLKDAGRLADAREYALAALRNYESFGDRAAEEIEKTKGLVGEIEEAMKGG